MNVTARLIERENEFIEYKSLRLFCGTYNVNGKQPDEDLSRWLRVASTEVDIYAIGFQEIVDLNTTSFLLKSDWVEREESWIGAVHAALNGGDDDAESQRVRSKSKGFSNYLLDDEVDDQVKQVKYRMVSKIRMFGILLLVYVNERLAASGAVKEALTASVATGIMGQIGNKGSVGVSLKLFKSRVCFVCSHFASDTDKVEKRNADFRTAIERLKFRYDIASDTYDCLSHDIIFWLGDLNYRLDGVSLNDTLRMIRGNDVDGLLKFDQLTRERSMRRTFEGFDEGRITFRPTYKFLLKSNVYEKEAGISLSAALDASLNSVLASTQAQTKSNGKLSSTNPVDPNDMVGKTKLPSWTDRIQWRTITNGKVELIKYDCVGELKISDHKPVYALFHTQVRDINQRKFDEIYEWLLKEKDRNLNYIMPKISVDIYDLNFGDCFYYDVKALRFQIKNDGAMRASVDIQFYDERRINELNVYDRVAQILSNTQSCRYPGQWVRVSPSHKENFLPGTVMPVDVLLDLNRSLMRRLRSSKTRLDDFLIVKCLNGNDVFITISLNYKHTLMGVSLRALTTLDKTDYRRFESPDSLRELFDVVERRIERVESDLDSLWTARLSEDNRLLVDANNNNNQQLLLTQQMRAYKVDLHFRCLSSLMSEALERDIYFLSELADEYEFFLGHLIRRAQENVSFIERTSQLLDKRESTDLDSLIEKQLLASRDSTLTVEEQKTFVLIYLTSREFESLERATFSIELLADVLYDLLYAMPVPVVPKRYMSFCALVQRNYSEASRILNFLARSHLKLFELIVKFLQIYLRCLPSCDSNLNEQLAEALFHVEQSAPTHLDNNSDDSRSTAITFLNLFIDNHKTFITIS